jgi:shikimate dehydrogenase
MEMEGGQNMAKNYRAELIFLLGDPVDGNPTGAVEEAAFAHKGLNWRYINCLVPVEDLGAAFQGVKALGGRGLNLTMPHKIAIIPMLDELTQAAQLIGAVNTVYVRDGRYIGENTDGKGFVQSLVEADIPLQGKVVTLLGAGGAARAIGMECALAGARHIHVINRDHGRGQSLVDALNASGRTQADFASWQGDMAIPADTDILVNATSIGLHPHGEEYPPIDYSTVSPGMAVCDVVFNPARTVFLNKCAARGAQAVTGLGMLVNQAALNFSLWTGETAPRELMMRTLSRELEDS